MKPSQAMKWSTLQKSSLVLSALSLLIVLLPQFANAGWYNNNWTYRKQITISSSMVPNTDQTNFPVLISTTDANLPGHALSTGNDILFTSSDGTTKLNHEIEKYTSPTGELVAWVNVPTLSHTANTVLYMYYGNSGAADQQNVNATWNGNYKGVWHLKENPAGTAPQMKDSTSNANNGTTAGTMTSGQQVAGQIDGSLHFDGSNDYVDAGNGSSLNITGAVTVEAWIKTTADFNPANDAYRNIVAKDDINNAGYGLEVYERQVSNNTWVEFWTRGVALVSVNFFVLNNFATNTWVQLVGVYDGTNNKVYMNGALQNSKAGTAPASSSNGLRIANARAVNIYDKIFPAGEIDEVRVLSGALSPDWIATEYNNQSSPASYETFAAEELLVRTTLGTGTAPSNKTVLPNDTNKAVDAFTLSTTTGSDTLTSLTVTFSGTRSADVAGVKLYLDNGSTPNEWDSSDTVIATGILSGSTVTFSGLNIGINTTPSQYLITYDISSTPVAGDTLQATITSATVSNTLLNNDTADATLTVASFCNVTTTVDSATPGSGSLRSCIIWANSHVGADTIILPAGTYTLTIAGANEDAAASGDLDITGTVGVTINGGGQGTTIIDGNGTDRVFDLSVGSNTFTDLTIRNGNAGNSLGGGIYYHVPSGTTQTLTRVTVTGNTNTSQGPGIYLSLNTTCNITDSVISNNSTTNGGGGIDSSGTLTIANTTISGNSGTAGGGVNNGGTMTIDNSVINNNTASSTGGGIHNSPGTATLTNVTISANTSPTGGGINFKGTLNLTNITIYGNITGRGIEKIAGTATTSFKNTIIAGNAAGNCSTTFTSGGYNLESATNTCGFTGTGDQNTVSAGNLNLAALANNGGPTQTHALLAGSFAIDKIASGTNGCGTTVTTDQRGIARPQNGSCDVGAYEYVPSVTTIGDGTSPSNKTVSPNNTNKAVDAFTLATSSGTDTLTALTVTFTGTNVSDIAASGVKIWRDDGTTANEWDASDTQIGSATSFSGTTATFSGLSVGITTTPTQYLVTYNIAAAPGAGDTLQGAVTAATVTNSLTNSDTVDATLTVAAVSGTVYTDEGVTNIGGGKTVRLVKNGASIATATTDTSGAYAIPATLAASDALLVYIDGDATYKGTTVSVAGGAALAGLNIYAGSLITRHDNAGSLSNANMSTAKGAYVDTDIEYSVDGSNILTVSGTSTTLYIPATHTYAPGANVTTVNLKNLGTITGGTVTFNVSGTWTNSGTFTANTSTVNLNGTNQTINGSTSFYNLTKSVATARTLIFAAGSTTTVNGTATLNGASGQLLSLRSGTPGTRWNFVLGASATKSISYVDVQDSDASGSDASKKPIKPTNSTDSGNNIDWFAHITVDGSFTEWCDGSGTEFCVDDEGGNNDWTDPARLDITRAGVASNRTDTFYVLFGYDDTSLTQESTACVLVDTDSDNYINKAICTVINNSPTTVSSAKLYNCDDSIIGGCGGATLSKTYGVSDYGISNTSSGPWNTDTLIELKVPYTDLGIANGTIILNTLISYPGSTLLKAPKDSIFGATTQDYEKRIQYDTDDGTGVIIAGPGNQSVSGIVYSDEGTTAIGSGKIIRLIKNGVSVGTDTTDATGGYFISGAIGDGDGVIVYIDGDDGNVNDGTTVTVFKGPNLTTLDIYKDHLITRHDNAGSLTNALMNTAKGAYADTEILYSVSGVNLTVSGTGTELYVPTGHTFVPGGNVSTVHVQIVGTWTGGNNTYTLSGNWSNSGVFSASSSAVVLNGTDQSITGNTTFNNLTKSVATARTLTFTASSTTTVNGTATLNGAASNLLRLRSSTPGTKWNFTLNAGATKSISYVDVQDSDASGSDAALKPINPANSTDNGNTVAWFSYVDALIKLASEGAGAYLSDNVYESTASTQVKTQGVVSGSAASFNVQFQNDGTATDSIVVTGTGSGSNFTVQYLDDTSTDRTASVTGAGYTIASLAAGASKVWTVNVTPAGNPTPVTGGTAYNVFVTATSSSDSNKKDQVKATTTSTSANLTLLKNADKGNANPGDDISYTTSAMNGSGLTDASSIVLTDPIPTYTGFKVGGATFNAGTSTLTSSMSYSNNNGTSWTYTPASGGCSAPAGYDYCVTDVRWTMTGTMPSGTSFSVGLVVRVK